jgi:hypothetical protein
MKQKKKMTTSNKVLAAAIIAVIAFTALSFVLQFTVGLEVPATLTEYWYKFWTCELIVLSGIKVSKVFKGYHGIVIEDEVTEELFEDEFTEEITEEGE